MRAIPMPSVIDPEPVDFERAVAPRIQTGCCPGDSTSTVRIARRRDFRYSDTPANVPPVPEAAVNASTRPLVWRPDFRTGRFQVCLPVDGVVELVWPRLHSAATQPGAARLSDTGWDCLYGTVGTLCTSAPNVSSS